MALSEEYKRDGCLLIQNFLTIQETSQLSSILERIHQKWLLDNKAEIQESQLINTSSLTHPQYYPAPFQDERLELLRFLSSDKLLNLVRQVLNPPIFFLNTQLFFNPPNFTKAGYWHRDTQYLGKSETEQKLLIHSQLVIHLHIPLIDDDLFEFIPGSHVRWDFPHEREIRLELAGHKNHEIIPESRSFPAKVGDIVLFSVHGIHRGRVYSPNPQRRTFDVLYGTWFDGANQHIVPECLPTSTELPSLKNTSIFGLT